MQYLVTAALPYSNGHLHVGHIAGAYLPADIYVRFRKARGDNVRFICGSDDNGVAALIAARKEGISVEELTASYNRHQKSCFDGLGIAFDIYGGTHQPGFVDLHERISQDIFLRIHEKGFLEKRQSRQLYDVQAGQFLPDRFVRGRCYHMTAQGTPCDYPEAYGDQCEACGRAIDPLLLKDPVSVITGARPVTRQTTHWHLLLNKLQQEIHRWLTGKAAPDDGSPAWRQGVLRFSLTQIEEGLPDRAMTRDLDWGVPVPLDDPDASGKCLYVWFDAPIGYISFTACLCRERDGDWRQYEKWWRNPECRIVNFVGEDNTLFHAITFPAMLMAEGSYQLPWQVVVNSFLNIKYPQQDEQKISKSRGNAIWIKDYLRGLDPDPLRYYLTAIAPEGQRTAFDPKDFVNRNNGELLSALGNFVNRTITFCHKYFGGKIPDAGIPETIDESQLERLKACSDEVAELLESFRFKAGLERIMSFARDSNQYFDRKKPWLQRKDDLMACGTTMNICCRTVKALMTFTAPFLPFSAEKTAEMLQLNFPGGIIPWGEAVSPLPADHPLGKPIVLFRRIEIEELI
jgi:methionyl-tRNA synthetase